MIDRVYDKSCEQEFLNSLLSEEAFNQGKDTKPAVNSAAVASVIADSSNAPSGTPLMELRDKLEPHAAAGDLAAAARLAHDATNCAYSDYDISWMQALIENASRGKPEVAQRHRQLLAALPEKIAAAQKLQKAVCTGVSRSDSMELAKNTTLRAAKLGDADSQLCALTYNFVDPYNEAVITNYQDQGFSRGDWRIVRLMALRTLSLGRGGRIGGRMTNWPTDPSTYYRMMTLLRLGASGNYAQDLDDEIEKFVESNTLIVGHMGVGMPADQQVQGDAWAKEQFQKHFSLSPKLNAAPGLCGEF